MFVWEQRTVRLMSDAMGCSIKSLHDQHAADILPRLAHAQEQLGNKISPEDVQVPARWRITNLLERCTKYPHALVHIKFFPGYDRTKP